MISKHFIYKCQREEEEEEEEVLLPVLPRYIYFHPTVGYILINILTIYKLKHKMVQYKYSK